MARLSPVRQQALSVSLATGAYAISFGALSVAAGLDLWQTMALSLLVFSGGSQFAFVGIIGAGGLAAAPAAIATATMLSIRNGLYGLQTSQFLGVRGLHRAAAAQLTIDESTAVGLAQPELPAQRVGFWHTGIAVFVFWNIMTLVGSLAGNAIGDPKVYGLDGAAVAAFTALLWPRLQSMTARLTALLAIGLALVSSPLVPAGIPVLIAALAAVAFGLRSAAKHEEPLEGRDGRLPGSDPVP